MRDVTAAAIADLSLEDMIRALEQLADFTVFQITERLRFDLISISVHSTGLLLQHFKHFIHPGGRV